MEVKEMINKGDRRRPLGIWCRVDASHLCGGICRRMILRRILQFRYVLYRATGMGWV
jgi:hypothetical protein